MAADAAAPRAAAASAAVARGPDPAEAAKVLAIARSVAEDAKRLQAQLTVARAERDEAQRGKASLAQEIEALRAELAAARAEHTAAHDALALEKQALQQELDTLKSQRAEEHAAGEKELGELRSRLEGATRDRALLATDAEALRLKLAASQQELHEARASTTLRQQAPLQPGTGAAGLADAARLELHAAWEVLATGPFCRLRAALEAVGVRKSGDGTCAAVAAEAAAAAAAAGAAAGAGGDAGSPHPPPSPPPPPSQQPAGGGGEARAEGKARKEKKRKKEKGGAVKAEESVARPTAGPQENGQGLLAAEEEPAGRHRPLPHRSTRPGRSALKRPRRGPGAAAGPAPGADGTSLQGRSLRFAPAAEENGHALQVTVVPVASYRPCGEQLWYDNPQAHVQCERCGGRCPQQQGRLQGGDSFFACRQFFCTGCLDALSD